MLYDSKAGVHSLLIRVPYDFALCPSLPGMDRCRDPDFLLLRHRPGGPHSPRQLQSLQQQLLQVGTRLCPACPALPCPGAVGLPNQNILPLHPQGRHHPGTHQQWNQLLCWVCGLLHPGLYGHRAGCAHLQGGRIR